MNDIKVFALYFNETEREYILDEYKPQPGMGEIGLRLTLLKGIKETDSEKFLGFNYIGIELGGDFHTFHCHDLGEEFSTNKGSRQRRTRSAYLSAKLVLPNCAWQCEMRYVY